MGVAWVRWGWSVYSISLRWRHLRKTSEKNELFFHPSQEPQLHQIKLSKNK